MSRTAPTSTPNATHDRPARSAAAPAACRRPALLPRAVRRRCGGQLGCRQSTVRSQICASARPRFASISPNRRYRAGQVCDRTMGRHAPSTTRSTRRNTAPRGAVAGAEIAAPRPARHRTRHLLARVAAAAAVAVIAASVTVWRHARPGAPAKPGGGERGGDDLAVTASTTHPRATPAAGDACGTRGQTRAILAGIATIKVTDYPVPAWFPPRSGQGQPLDTAPIPTPSSVSAPIGGHVRSAILGTLSSHRVTGADPTWTCPGLAGKKGELRPGRRLDAGTTAPTARRWPSARGTTRRYPVESPTRFELVRPDGADIELHLSTSTIPRARAPSPHHTPADRRPDD